MKQNLRSGNTVLLMDRTHKHNYYSKLTLEYNKIFKYVSAVIYFLFIPIVNTVFEFNHFLRLFFGSAAIVLSLFSEKHRNEILNLTLELL
jgi:uncharacterized membrane protein